MPNNNQVQVPDSDLNNEIYRGSFQETLSMNTGNYVIVEFLVGTNNLTTKSGILYSVSSKTLVLYQSSIDAYIVCDIFNVKFVTFVDQNRGESVGETNTVSSQNVRTASSSSSNQRMRMPRFR